MAGSSTRLLHVPTDATIVGLSKYASLWGNGVAGDIETHICSKLARCFEYKPKGTGRHNNIAFNKVDTGWAMLQIEPSLPKYLTGRGAVVIFNNKYTKACIGR